MPFKGAFQSTWLGYTIRLVSGNKILPYPDEKHVPERYTPEGIEKRKKRREAQIHRAAAHISEGLHEEQEEVHRAINETGWEEALGEKVRVKVKRNQHKREEHTHLDEQGQERAVQPGSASEAERGQAGGTRPAVSRSDSEETVVDVPVRSGAPYGARANIEKALKAVEKAEHGERDPNLVSWLGPDDPENP